MSALPTIFISYAHEGTDRGTLKAFEALLARASGGEIEILVDNRLEIGDQISKHIGRLKSCDAAIILLSPEYKSRVEARKGGVYEEYKLIKNRLDINEEGVRHATDADKRDHFLTFPILFAATKESSCPRDLADHLFEDMVYFRAHETDDGEFVVSQQIRRQYEKVFTAICSKVFAACTLKLRMFRDEYKRNFDALFVETKAERMRHKLTTEQWAQILVSTRAFSMTSSQQSLLLVGRKGSGKSTIVQHLFDENPRKYKSRIHVDLERFNLQPLYDLIYSEQVRSEIKSLYEPVGFFRCAWTLFLFLCCSYTLSYEQSRGELTQEQKQVGSAMLNFIQSSPFPEYWNARGYIDYFLLFSHCIETIAKDLSKNVGNALADPNTKSMTSVIARVREHNLVERIVGTDVFNSFINVAKRCTRKFLFSLDGFDTKFDEFRRTTIMSFSTTPPQAADRTTFEISWLRGLFHTIMMLRDEFFDQDIHDKIDFCVTVPKDRYLEARKADRDGFIYDDRMSNLDWRARELFLMIRKRLDVMNNFYHKDGEAMERLWKVIDTFYPGLPKQIGIEHRGKAYRIDLERYILRHTFWRPRDMLKYYAKVLAFHDVNKRRRRKIDDVAIRYCIAETTAEIVETEFLNEFRGICYNLDDIIQRFWKKPQLLDHKQLYDIIDAVEFEHTNDTYKPKTFRQKFEFLYQIGFLGIKLSQEWAEDWRTSTDEIFYFSDGDNIANALSDDELQLSRFIVHPVFCEKLRIDTKGSDLVLMYSDTYIDRNDRV
jgi:energy-coupling factor transporter ATP-binding protein EcfA2